MFNTLFNNIYFRFHYDVVRRYYEVISNKDNKEEIYFDGDELFIVVKDEEIGKRLYSVLKTVKDSEKTISYSQSHGKLTLKLKKFGCSKQDIVKYISFSIDSNNNWNDFENIEKLEAVISFVENMQNLGLYLDWSKFETFNFDCFSEFLSHFVHVDGYAEIPKDLRIEYLHYMLSKGGKLEEFYKDILDKHCICSLSDFPYSLPIVKICYSYYKDGEIPKKILEKVQNERCQSRNDNILILLDRDLLESKYEVTESNDEFIIFNDNMKIYHNISKAYSRFLRHRQFDESETFERMHELIIDVDDNVIGYVFSFDETDEFHGLIDRKIDGQAEIIDYVKKIHNYIYYFRNYEYIVNEFDVEEAVLYSETSDKFKIRTIKDLFNLVYRSRDSLEKSITEIFFKLLLSYINVNGELNNEKQFFDRLEIRVLNPIVAREFINFALGREVDYNSATINFYGFLRDMKASEIEDFLENMKSSINLSENLYYDPRFEFNPLKKPFLFEDEVEEKYNINVKLNRGSDIKLDDGRRLAIFNRSKKQWELSRKLQNTINEIHNRLGDIEDDHVYFSNISEVIYSKELNSNGMYKVIGYVADPIQGELLTIDYLLGLNNKQLYKVAGYLFSKFSNYDIPWDCIYVDNNFVFSIDILSNDFFIRKARYYRSSSYIDEQFENLVRYGYNSNAFVGIDLTVKNLIYLSNNADAYCDDHKIYYDSSKGLCPICLKTKFLIEKYHEGILPRPFFEDSIAKHYELQDGYYLKIYKNFSYDLKKIEENIDLILDWNIQHSADSNMYQTCFIPYKKALDNNRKFVGYVYAEQDFENDASDSINGICIDIKESKKLTNLSRLKSLIRLLLQVKDITSANKGFVINPFTHVYLNSRYKRQVQILNIDLLVNNENIQETRKWACEYVCNVLATDTSMEVDISEWSNDFEGLLSTLQDAAQHMTRYCNIHKMYYRDDYIFCPKCVDKKTIQDIQADICDDHKFEGLASENEGGEAFIYPYEKDKVAKIFKKDIIDYSMKSLVIHRILLKKDILENINAQNHKYKYIIPKKLILGQESKDILGYVMTEVKAAQPVSNLRDKKIVENLGFTTEDVLEILITIGDGIEMLHKKANIFIGDLNGRNILFDSEKNIYFLDFDGMGVDEICPEFCTDGYIDPVSKKNQNITMKDDWYSFAIQAFYYLTYTHPFNGIYYEIQEGKKVALDIPEKMEKKISLLGNHGMSIPNIALSWDWMTDKLILAFKNIFEGNERISIVPVLKDQYNRIQTLNSNDSQPFNRTVVKVKSRKKLRLSPKFSAVENTPFDVDVIKVINPYSAICKNNDGSFYLAVLIGDNNKKVRKRFMKVPNCADIKDVVLSEDKENIFIIYSKKVLIFKFKLNKLFNLNLSDDSKIVVGGNSIYYTENSEEGKFYINKRTILDDGSVQKNTINLGKHKFKWFNVKFDTKFVLVERTKVGIDRVYCNSEKFCDIKYLTDGSQYKIIYDDLNKSWLVVNSDGNGVVINSDGTSSRISISEFVNNVNIDNIEFRKGKIYIPCSDYLCIINANDQATKKMECHEIMTPKSKLYNINPEGFSVITDNVCYEVSRE